MLGSYSLHSGSNTKLKKKLQGMEPCSSSIINYNLYCIDGGSELENIYHKNI